MGEGAKRRDAGAASGRAGHAGRVVRPAKNRKTQVIRTSGKRWSQAAERVFLEELAATANVRAAAAAAGFSTTAIYLRRMRCPGFAAQWQACLEQGYARLETRLVELATASLTGTEGAPGGEGDGAEGGVVAERTMSVGEAMNLLRLHRAAAKGGAPQRYDSRAKPMDIEAVRASILRKIEAIERAAAADGGTSGA